MGNKKGLLKSILPWLIVLAALSVAIPFFNQSESSEIRYDKFIKIVQDEKVKKESDTKTTEEVQVKTYEEVTSEKEVYSINLAANSENEVPYNEIISNQVVNYALKFVGGPYVYGGNSLTNGTDCSGFTKLVFANYGVYLPRSAPEQAYAGVHVDLNDIKPGDIIVSGYDGVVCHAALYIGDGKLVHALNSNVGIVVTSMYIMPIIDVRRVA